MQPFTIGSKTVSIFPSTEPEAPIIYLNTFSDEGLKVYETVQATAPWLPSVIWTGTTTGALGQSACFQKCRSLHRWCR